MYMLFVSDLQLMKFSHHVILRGLSFWREGGRSTQFVMVSYSTSDCRREGGGGTPLYTAARVGVFEPFWSQNEYRLCLFWSGIGEYGFRGNHASVSRIYCLNSK